METSEALEVLLHAARRQVLLDGEEVKSAGVLVKELGFHAVALVQAGSFCRMQSSGSRPYTFTQYLKLFYEHPTKLMKQSAPASLDGYQRGVYTTLDLSYQAIPPASRECLHFLSHFHHTDIPLSAFAASASQGFADSETYLERPTSHLDTVSALRRLLCPDGAWDELHVVQMISTLRSFSLVSMTSIGDCIFIQLNPMVQAWSRAMVSSTSQEYRAMVIQVFTSCGRGAEFSLKRYLLPHLLDMLDQINMQDLHVNNLVAVGEILGDQGRYHRASMSIEEAMKKMSYPGASSETKLMLTTRLAFFYWNEGRRDEAEKLEMDVLEQRRKVLGMEHPDTITAAANLAYTYTSQDRRAEAGKLGADVLEQRRKVLGMEYPDTITAAANLAYTYTSQGRWDEAEKLWADVLEQRRKVLGTDHRDTMTAAVRLALTYCEQGRWADAETLQLDALERSQTIFGSQHSHTMAVGDNLIATYNEQEKWEEAVRLQVDLLVAKRRMLGDEHPRVISALATLASRYHFHGQLGAAEKLNLEVLDRRRVVMGENHQYTILTSESLCATRSLRQESNFVRQLISTMFPQEDFAEKVPKESKRPPTDVVEEPCLWYYETIPLSNATGERSIVHKGRSYCLPLVPLNSQLSETSIVIGENSTFSEISSQLYSVEESALPVALEQTGGPYPRWRIPKTTTKIPRGLQKIYIADISKPFMLALVRDVGGDVPLLIDISSLKSVGKKTVGDVIGGTLEGRGHSWSSIKLLSGPGDIQESSYTLIQKQTRGLYSTIFFVLMNDDPQAYNFRSDEECMGPLPLRIVFFQSQRLVDSAPCMMVLTLPAIHLSRALHHLIICLGEEVEETIGAYFISRLNSLVSKLKANFQKIENRVDDSERAVRQYLIQFFYELCEEQPGVVAVRQSFESFKAFVVDGLGDIVESEYFPVNSETSHEGALEEHQLIQAEGPSDPHGGNDSTGSGDSSSSYDGDSSVESVEHIGALETAGNGQEVDG